jgi:glutathione S-transferase
MSLEVFWGSGSPYAWRVMLALEHKGIAYESRLLSFTAREHKSARFLAINPRGQVPAIRDGDYCLHESLAILWYLERRNPDPPIFGRDARETGKIMEVVDEFDSHLHEPANHVIRPLFMGGAQEKFAEMRAALDNVHGEFVRLEDHADGSDWLVGNTPTAADFVVYPFVALLRRALEKPAGEGLRDALLPLDRDFPALAAWARRLEALPYFAKTFPPHWK